MSGQRRPRLAVVGKGETVGRNASPPAAAWG